jgi:transcriptional regulator with XRE-family HTH domain
MPRNPYTPTEADALTGQKIRALRQRAGETLRQTAERSGFGKDASTLAATERGERLLNDVEATKLAAHFGIAADRLRVTPKRPALLPSYGMPAPMTEQEFLGNDKPATLFAVPDTTDYTRDELAALAIKSLEPVERAALGAVIHDGLGAPIVSTGRTITIHRDRPLTPEQYRAEVWIPYLEARYATETKAG